MIEADALRPNSAYSGNLYSTEYFQMLKAHLKPDGLAVTWAPTDRVLASFLAVFPHVIVVDGIAIGSQQPLEPIRRRSWSGCRPFHERTLSPPRGDCGPSFLVCSPQFLRLRRNPSDPRCVI